MVFKLNSMAGFSIEIARRIEDEMKPGEQTFALIRSVIHTNIKSGNNVLESLNLTAQLGA